MIQPLCKMKCMVFVKIMLKMMVGVCVVSKAGEPSADQTGASRYIGIKFVVSLKEAFVLYETVFAQLRQAVVRVRL